MTNLIANAVKFTERGCVDVRVTRTAAGRIRFVIEDTGIGIAREDLARLFLPFERAADAARRGYGGTGLGLSIAKALTDAMGGTLTAASRRQGGSRFTLELPLPAVEPVESSGVAPPSPHRRTHRPTVLVVDDSPVGRELVCEMLRGLGAEVRSAATGEQAVAEVMAAPPELVLMDLQMPDLDGATTTQLIRAQTLPGAPRPRIVALTANAFGRAQALGSSGGMDGYLVKPARIADLRALLDRIADETDVDRVPSVVAGGQPLFEPSGLDAAVVRDLSSAKTREGRSLLEVAGLRVLEDTPACLAQIDAAIRGKHLPPAAHVAHRVKGNCLMVGASTAAACAQRLDDALAQDDAKAARVQFRTLSRAFDELERTLRAMIGMR
ncbi:MAG: response regulator [Deltaproteobacteria bacterium]|nr:response regulator [Deltaproteobacteria bacterium]